MKIEKRPIIIILICILLIIPSFFSVHVDYRSKFVLKDDLETLQTIDPDEDEPITRSSSSRANYEISSTTAISMPKVYDTWNQSDWSGGSGQDIWSDETKYSSSNDINDTSSNGPLKLSDGEDVDAWEQLADGFGARYRHRMVWNPTRNVFYTFGGVAGSSNVVNELYEYNPVNGVWTQKGQSGGPSARCSSLVVYDTKSSVLWVYGGRDRANPGGNQFNDLWGYNPNTDQWTQKSNGPGARSDSAGSFDPNTREIIMYGGYIGGSEFSSNQVWVYNTQTDNWIMKHNYTKRYYHAATWSPYTNSMFVYGGAEIWSGDFTYVNELNEYFPTTDTWVNRTPIGNRVRSILVWDTLNNKLILHGGGEPDRNDTRVYDTDADAWTSMSNGPAPPRDRVGGDWDTVRHRLVTFGGTINSARTAEVWFFSPNVTGFNSNGGLVSSAFATGSKINLNSVSFELSQPLPPGVGPGSVKIQIAGSVDSTIEPGDFVGYNGNPNTYFTLAGGQSTPAVLDGSTYIAYKVDLSTGNRVNTPELNQIIIEYYTYPDSYAFESTVTTIPGTKGLPLRHVTWTGSEPDGTSIKVYFRQSYNQVLLSSLAWEEVVPGQTSFTYDQGIYFQYRVFMATTEPGHTPELTTINFEFNALPEKPIPLTPVNNTWVGDPDPVFNWTFIDPDLTDHQGGLELSIALDEEFQHLTYSSNRVDSTNSSFEITTTLNDGTYYWRVRTYDNYGSESPWSVSFLLKIDTKKPGAPKVETYSHSFEHLWYSNDWPYFHWNEPVDISGIKGYSYILDQSPTTDPEGSILMTDEDYRLKHNVSDFKGLVSFDNMEDGIWYFHVRAVDSLGTWSDTSTRMIRIDTDAPLVTDLTQKNVTAGSTFNFRFRLNDSYSGVDLTPIYYKYGSQADLQNDVLSDEGQNLYSFSHNLQLTSDSYIEYYIEVDDNAEPKNTLRYPGSGYLRINILDEEPPKITDVTGNKEHNRYINLEIHVEATDNVGLKEATVYFNDQGSGIPMTETDKGKFQLVIDRVELLNMAGYGGENTILYHVKVWDYYNNSDREPTGGNFKITLLDIEDSGNDPAGTEEEGFSQALMFNILILVIVIVIVGIVLFFFIRKQGEKMDEDRHKLRMAISDVEEAKGGGAVSPDFMPPSSALESVPSLYGPAGQGPGGIIPSQLPPSDSTQVAPFGYLPEAPMHQESTAYQHDELPRGFEQKDQVPQPRKESAVAEKKKEPAVEVENGLFVSLPKDEG